MSRELIVRASFERNEVDLAAELREWREFVEGEGYAVDLRDEATGERVAVRYFDDGWGEDYLSIKSTAPGDLFERVVGRIIAVLTAQIGELKIRRYPSDPERLFTPKFKKN